MSDLFIKIQILSIFHHLQLTRYKCLLSNTRNDLKGRCGEIPYQERKHWIKGP